jgi:hypothetical protein
VKGGLFAKDLKSGDIEVISAMKDEGESVDQVAVEYDVSSDGRFVAYTTSQDVFVFDCQSKRTTRVDTDADGNGLTNARPSYGKGAPSLSADGRYISFSVDSDLPEKKNGKDTKSDIYVKDMQTGPLTLASTNEKGQPADGDNIDASLSADGDLLVFESRFTNLSNTTSLTDNSSIYLKELKTGKVQLLTSGTNPSLSKHGRFVTYVDSETSSSQVSCLNSARYPNVLLLDLQENKRKKVAVPTGWDSWSPLKPLGVSDTGVVAFTSSAYFATFSRKNAASQEGRSGQRPRNATA